MAIAKREVFAIPVTGVGRKDYSEQVEYSVEPIVRSYQSAYVYDEVYTVQAGQTRVIDVVIPLNTVVLLYDFLASIPANRLLGFGVSAIDSVGGLVNPIFFKSEYQKVVHHHSRGAPVFMTIRITLTNYCTIEDVDVAVTLIGVYTGVQEYRQQVGTI